VGLGEEAGPVHEISKHLVLHPRGDRPAAEARGRAAVRVDRGPPAKDVTDPGPVRATVDRSRQPSLVARVMRPVGLTDRPLAPVRSTERTGGRGNARDPTGTRWWAIRRARDRTSGQHGDADSLPPLADGREEMKYSPRALQPKFRLPHIASLPRFFSPRPAGLYYRRINTGQRNTRHLSRWRYERPVTP
jgi:hypothetical protein